MDEWVELLKLSFKMLKWKIVDKSIEVIEGPYPGIMVTFPFLLKKETFYSKMNPEVLEYIDHINYIIDDDEELTSADQELWNKYVKKTKKQQRADYSSDDSDDVASARTSKKQQKTSDDREDYIATPSCSPLPRGLQNFDIHKRDGKKHQF